jgi:hypothetical protein
MLGATRNFQTTRAVPSVLDRSSKGYRQQLSNYRTYCSSTESGEALPETQIVSEMKNSETKLSEEANTVNENLDKLISGVHNDIKLIQGRVKFLEFFEKEYERRVSSEVYSDFTKLILTINSSNKLLRKWQEEEEEFRNCFVVKKNVDSKQSGESENTSNRNEQNHTIFKDLTTSKMKLIQNFQNLIEEIDSVLDELIGAVDSRRMFLKDELEKQKRFRKCFEEWYNHKWYNYNFHVATSKPESHLGSDYKNNLLKSLEHSNIMPNTELETIFLKSSTISCEEGVHGLALIEKVVDIGRRLNELNHVELSKEAKKEQAEFREFIKKEYKRSFSKEFQSNQAHYETQANPSPSPNEQENLKASTEAQEEAVILFTKINNINIKLDELSSIISWENKQVKEEREKQDDFRKLIKKNHEERWDVQYKNFYSRNRVYLATSKFIFWALSAVTLAYVLYDIKDTKEKSKKGQDIWNEESYSDDTKRLETLKKIDNWFDKQEKDAPSSVMEGVKEQIAYQKSGEKIDFKNVVSVVIIEGVPGSGRTDICKKYGSFYAKKIKSLDPNNSLLIYSFNGKNSIKKEFEDFAKKIGITVQHEEVKAAVAKRLTERHNWLLIFNDLENYDIIAPYIPEKTRGRILITTNDVSKFQKLSKKHDWIMKYDDYKLSKKEAITLLGSVSNTLDLDNGNSDKFKYLLSERLNYYPLLLKKAAVYIKYTKTTFRDYINTFDKEMEEIKDKEDKKDVRNILNCIEEIAFKEISGSTNTTDEQKPELALLGKIYTVVDIAGNKSVSMEALINIFHEEKEIDIVESLEKLRMMGLIEEKDSGYVSYYGMTCGNKIPSDPKRIKDQLFVESYQAIEGSKLLENLKSEESKNPFLNGMLAARIKSYDFYLQSKKYDEVGPIINKNISFFEEILGEYDLLNSLPDEKLQERCKSICIKLHHTDKRLPTLYAQTVYSKGRRYFYSNSIGAAETPKVNFEAEPLAYFKIATFVREIIDDSIESGKGEYDDFYNDIRTGISDTDIFKRSGLYQCLSRTKELNNLKKAEDGYLGLLLEEPCYDPKIVVENEREIARNTALYKIINIPVVQETNYHKKKCKEELSIVYSRLAETSLSSDKGQYKEKALKLRYGTEKEEDIREILKIIGSKDKRSRESEFYELVKSI